ncbi:MAG: PepSY-like domain-containing protein [Paludibacteraceae bacterium]|nr:PepSY-like domain-containing protein [Paludibacteraceae bacterium]
MKKVFLLALASIFSVLCFAKEDGIKILAEQLPEKASLFIKDYFPTAKIKAVYKKWDEGVEEYKVIFKTKTTIEFDMVGAWSEIDVNAKKDKMPRFIYSNPVNETLDREFFDKTIDKVENDGVYYDFDFTDKSEAKIKTTGQVVEFEQK